MLRAGIILNFAENNIKTTNTMKTQNIRITVSVMLMVAALGMGTARAQQWQRLQTGTHGDLYGVCCVDEETVFACGSDGQIVRTTDGGASWTELYNEPGVDWYRIRFLNGSTGFALGRDNVHQKGRLMKTEDGGTTWHNKDSFESIAGPYVLHYLYECDLFLVDADTLYVAYDNLLKSTDGGETFFMPDESLDYLGLAIRLYFEDHVGYIVFGELGGIMSYRVLKTEDYGNNWDVVFEDPFEYGNGLPVPHFIDKNHIDIYGTIAIDDEIYGVLRTDDGFLTQEMEWNNLAGATLIDGKFTSMQNGMMIFDCIIPLEKDVRTCPEVAHTRNGGETWEQEEAGLPQELDLFSIDGIDTTFYMTSENGVVYKWGRQVTQETGEGQRSIVDLTPNPATGMVTITGEGIREVEVHNLLGQRVASMEGHDAASLTLSLDGLPQGVYLVSVRLADGKRCEKKLVVQQ